MSHDDDENRFPSVSKAGAQAGILEFEQAYQILTVAMSESPQRKKRPHLPRPYRNCEIK